MGKDQLDIGISILVYGYLKHFGWFLKKNIRKRCNLSFEFLGCVDGLSVSLFLMRKCFIVFVAIVTVIGLNMGDSCMSIWINE